VPPNVEIHHLREEVPKLEAKLREMIERWKRTTVIVEQQTTRPTALSVSSNNVQRWKETTLRQREQLSEAEDERERLRAELQIQKKLSRAIRKLLSARTVSIVVSTFM
jgi:predicted  nucleic acid-binding Zn-ribbon protein